jgi:hypothetical protein
MSKSLAEIGENMVEACQVNGVMQVSVKDLRKEFQCNDEKLKSPTGKKASKKVTNISGYFGALSGSPGKCFGGAKVFQSAENMPTPQSIPLSTTTVKTNHRPVETTPSQYTQTKEKEKHTKETISAMISEAMTQYQTNLAKKKTDRAESFNEDNFNSDQSASIYGDVKLRKVTESKRNYSMRKKDSERCSLSSSPVRNHGNLQGLNILSLRRRLSMPKLDMSIATDSKDESPLQLDWARNHDNGSRKCSIPNLSEKDVPYASAMSISSSCGSSLASVKAANHPSEDNRSHQLKYRESSGKHRAHVSTSSIPTMAELGLKSKRLQPLSTAVTGPFSLLHAAKSAQEIGKCNEDAIFCGTKIIADGPPISCRTPSATDRELKELRSLCLTKKATYKQATTLHTNSPTTLPRRSGNITIGQSPTANVSGMNSREITRSTSYASTLSRSSVSTTPSPNGTPPCRTENEWNSRIQLVEARECLVSSEKPKPTDPSIHTFLHTNEFERVRKSLRSVQSEAKNEPQAHDTPSRPTVESETVHKDKRLTTREELEQIRALRLTKNISAKAETFQASVPEPPTRLSCFKTNDPNSGRLEGTQVHQQERQRQTPNSCRILAPVDCAKSIDSHDSIGSWMKPYNPFNSNLEPSSCGRLPPTASMRSDYTTDTEYEYDDDRSSTNENRYIQISLSSGAIAEKSEPNVVVSPTAGSVEDTTQVVGDGTGKTAVRYSWNNSYHLPMASPTDEFSPAMYHDSQRRISRETFKGAKKFFFGGKKITNRKTNLF